MNEGPALPRSPRRDPTLETLRLALIAVAIATPFLAQYGPLLRWGWTLCTNDVRLYAIPALHWVESRLHHGHLPVVAPIYGGYPIYADPQSLLWYPPAFLAGFLPTPANFQGLTLLHLAAVFAGCYALGRQLRLDIPSSLVIAVVWVNSGFFVTKIANVAAMFYALTWWPWLLWSLLRLDERFHLGRFAAALGFGALEILAGHPQMTFYFALLWLGWLMIGPLQRRRRTVYVSGAVGASVLLLTACAWVPWRMLSQETIRAAPTADFLRYFSLVPAWILGIILPRHSTGDYTYFGFLGVALALVGAWHRRRFGLGIIALAAVFMALAEYNPLYEILPRVPVFNQFRCPIRYLGITLFIFSILAGYATALLGRRRWLQVAVVVLVATELTFVKPQQRLYVLPFARYMQNSVAVEALRSRPRAPYFFYTDHAMRPLWVRPGRNEKALLDPQFRLMSDENLTWEMPSVQGYSPLAPVRQTRFLLRYGGSSDAGILNQPVQPSRLRELRRLGCRYILSTIALPELAAYPTTRLADGMLLYDLGPTPTVLLRGAGRILSVRVGESWREIDGVFDEPQSVVFTVGYWPELCAWVDGERRPVLAIGPNAAVRVPGGRHRIRIAYVPTSLFTGLRISAAFAMVLLAGLAWVVRQSRARHRSASTHRQAAAG